MAKQPKSRNAQAQAAWDRKAGAHTLPRRPEVNPICEDCGVDIDYCECDWDDLDEALFGEYGSAPGSTQEYKENLGGPWPDWCYEEDDR